MSEARNYAETAYDGWRDRASGPAARGDYAQHPRAKNGLLGGVHCREFLAVARLYAITFLNSDSAVLRRQLAEPGHESQYWESTANPAAMVRAFTTALGWMAIIAAVASVFMLVVHFDVLTFLGIGIFGVVFHFSTF